jgi:hypothetical protein
MPGTSGTGSAALPMTGTAGAPVPLQPGAAGAPPFAGTAGQPPIDPGAISISVPDSGCSVHATGTHRRTSSAALTWIALATLAACVRFARRRRGQ